MSNRKQLYWCLSCGNQTLKEDDGREEKDLIWWTETGLTSVAIECPVCGKLAGFAWFEPRIVFSKPTTAIKWVDYYKKVDDYEKGKGE